MSLSSTESKDLVLVAGYGSLLSKYSRKVYSDIHAETLPIIVNGWERGWITRGWDQKQTFAGAKPKAAASLNAQLIPMSFDVNFHQREKDYRYTRLYSKDLHLPDAINQHWLTLVKNTPIYICESLEEYPTDAEYPVFLSYVFTCFKGCYETGGKEGIKEFLALTKGWSNSHFVNDFKQYSYTRAAKIAHKEWDCFLQLLSETVEITDLSIE